MLAIVPPQRAIERKHEEEDENGKHSVAAVGLLFCLHNGISTAAFARLVYMHQPASITASHLYNLAQHLSMRCQVARVRLAQAMHHIVCRSNTDC